MRKYGTDLSRIVVVFPNKRASLFLNDALVKLAGRPLWSPRYITISELFREYASPVQVGDEIKLVCELYRVYTEVTGFEETIDHFYGWGQVLLSDFDDVDKNLAPADKVFANLRDIHELDDVSYLTDEQRELLRKFFSNFTDDHNSRLKERFLLLWSRIGDIYHRFNERLKELQIAYEGALYRSVVEAPSKPPPVGEAYCPPHPSKLPRLGEASTADLAQQASPTGGGLEGAYLFVGFNLLLPVEQRLFALLKAQGKARFYWDFDRYYMQSEAGYFISQYLDRFPNELDSSCEEIYDRFRQPKDIRFISASTENVQARYVAQWLTEQGQESRIEAGRRTAIVMCNEALLPTVIHSLPPSVGSVNITTGYPLQHTPVASFINLLYALLTAGYDPQRQRYRYPFLKRMEKHPYMKYLSPLQTSPCRGGLQSTPSLQTSPCRGGLQSTPSLQTSPCRGGLQSTPSLQTSPCRGGFQTAAGGGLGEVLSFLLDTVATVARNAAAQDAGEGAPLRDESFFRAYTLLNRLSALVEAGDLQVDEVTMGRLISQLIQQTTIPFHGEPAEGLQVMGVLETRNLDFDHLLLLSANEGNIPRGGSDTSFIPYSIRKAYGLTTIEHRVAIYAYYFHRLLSRAKDVTLVYNNATSDGQTGEMSRFMLQMLVESPHTIGQYTLRAGQAVMPLTPHPIEKTPAVLDVLRRRFSADRSSADRSSAARFSVCRDSVAVSSSSSPPAPLLTPTAINRYMRCPLQFYFYYVEGLREPDDLEEERIDNRLFGNIFHTAAQLLYERMMERSPRIMAGDIDQVLKQRVDIERMVDTAFRMELFKQADGTPAPTLPELNGLQIINREVIIRYLRQLLELDRRLTPFTILQLEKDVVLPLPIASLGITTTIGGRVDRLDSIVHEGEERIRVIDYKTGAGRLRPLPDVEAIFESDQLRNHSDYYLQTLLYARLVSRDHPGTAVAPALLFIQHTQADDYDPILCFGKQKILDVATADGDRFVQLLTEKVNEIFSPDLPFTPTDDRDRCRNCPYAQFCGTR